MDFISFTRHDAGMAQRFPKSPYDREGDILYFPRMLEKIRMKQRGELPEDYIANLGKGFDKNCCDFLHVAFDDVVARVEAGLDDAAVLGWCCDHGRRPDTQEIHVWNEYMRKRGWNDEYSERLKSRLEGLGMAGRGDLQTMFDLLEADEGRPPRRAGA
jgi:gluconokinase